MRRAGLNRTCSPGTQLSPATGPEWPGLGSASGRRRACGGAWPRLHGGASVRRCAGERVGERRHRERAAVWGSFERPAQASAWGSAGTTSAQSTSAPPLSRRARGQPPDCRHPLDPPLPAQQYCIAGKRGCIFAFWLSWYPKWVFHLHMLLETIFGIQNTVHYLKCVWVMLWLLCWRQP